MERQIAEDQTRSPTLGRWWVVLPDAEIGAILRLAEDSDAERLLPTRAEAEARGREALERRVAELETQLRRGGK